MVMISFFKFIRDSFQNESATQFLIVFKMFVLVCEISCLKIDYQLVLFRPVLVIIVRYSLPNIKNQLESDGEDAMVRLIEIFVLSGVFH